MEFLKDFFVLLGRVCISTMFLWAAYDKMTHWNATVAHYKSKHIPRLNLVLPAAFGLKVLGALLILLGWHAHIGALLLLIVAVPSVLYLHAFWKLQGHERAIELSKFRKEVAIIGGLLLLLALGAGNIAFGGN
jgi:putative oxidoreductase